MIEGLQNSSWMVQMDQILKQIGTEKAAEHFKVSINFIEECITQKHFFGFLDIIPGFVWDFFGIFRDF
jgi:hypothetical protein